MIAQLVLLLGVLALAWLVWDFVRRKHPRQAGKIMTALGLGLLVVFGIWLVLTGKLAGLAAIAAGLGPWIGRALKAHSIWRTVQNMRKPQAAPEQDAAARPAPKGAMSADEARDILGVPADAGADEIKAAHRRLMAANHPDRGGSTWIAARLNQARDTLLG